MKIDPKKQTKVDLPIVIDNEHFHVTAVQRKLQDKKGVLYVSSHIYTDPMYNSELGILQGKCTVEEDEDLKENEYYILTNKGCFYSDGSA